jgi:hypothetical protein
MKDTPESAPSDTSIIILTPVFERTDGKKVVYQPNTVEDFDKLKTYTDDHLKTLGLLRWDDHWLFPKEWYDLIPEGYLVVDICEVSEPFKKGETCNDSRFGALAYGFKR